MRRLAALAILASTAALVAGTASTAGAASTPSDVSPPAAIPGPPPGSPEGDRDGDRVSDDFEAELAAAAPADRLDVIVEGVRPGRARGAVGDIDVGFDLPIIGGFSASMTAAQVRGLLRVPGLTRVSGNGTVRALDDAGNRDFGVDAARADNQVDAATALDGRGVGICVVDTGVRPDHEQLSGRVVGFFDAVHGRPDAYDDHWHGTHVAGIALGDGTGSNEAVAARAVGVAPAARLYAAKVLDSSGSGTDDQVLAGIQWCVDQKAATPPVRVISMSLGDTQPSNGTDPMSNAVNTAVAAGLTVVVAAGNSGDSPGTVNSPGVAAGALTVGAVADWSAATTASSDTGIWLAAFSSRGPVAESGALKPDVTAPGVSVVSADSSGTSSYRSASGTSMAAPYVAGAAALALQADPATTPEQLKAAVMSTALDRGPNQADNDWGAGLVDVRALVDAVEDVGGPVATNVRTAFPTMQRLGGSVDPHGSQTFTLTIPTEGAGAPLAVTMTITSGDCGDWCLLLGPAFGEWSPDLDMELLDSSGRRLAVSECTLAGLSCGIGRQETIGVRPAAGTYTLRVYEWTGGAKVGGSFILDISHGPSTSGVDPADGDHKAAGGPTLDTGSGGGAPPPPDTGPTPPVAVASVDPNPCPATGSGRKAKCTFRLDGSTSHDPDDGTSPGAGIRAHEWRLGRKVVATTPALDQTKGVGSYTYTLTVTDDEGQMASVTLTVTVSGG